MPRLELTRRQLKGHVNAQPPNATAQTITSADGAQFDLLGGELLVIRNPNGIAVNATLKGVANDLARAVDLVVPVVAQGVCAIGPLKQEGWRQQDGKAYLDVASNMTAWLLTPP